MSKVYYLAGPMTGYPQFNFPLFEETTQRLRHLGFKIISPHETDPPDIQKIAWFSPDGQLDEHDKIGGETWGDILSRDVKLIADEIDGLFVLARWYESKGARLEVFVAMSKDIPVYSADYVSSPGDMHWAKRERHDLLEVIMEKMQDV